MKTIPKTQSAAALLTSARSRVSSGEVRCSIGGELADVVSTVVALDRGGRESVAATATVLASGGVPRLLALKLLTVVFAALLAAIVFRMGRPRGLWLSMQALWLGFACFAFAIAGHNLGIVGA